MPANLIVHRAMLRAVAAMGVLIAIVLPAPLARAGEPASPVSYIPAEAELPPSTPALIHAAVASGELDPASGELYLAYALGEPSKLPAPYRSSTPWRGTLPLLRLSHDLRDAPTNPTRAAAALALRGAGGATCSDSTRRLPDSTRTTHFLIQYDRSEIADNLSVNDYASTLETTWSTQIDSFGWAAPPVRRSPPGGRYHVRIDRLSPGLYGYVAGQGTYAGNVGNNPSTVWKENDAFASCMVLNQNYSGFPSPAMASLQATAAHEFNHSIQFGYGALTGQDAPRAVFVEGLATWMEDEVFDGSDDNRNYLWPKFASSMGTYSSVYPYPYWVVFRGLVERLGTGAPGGSEQPIQDFWELIGKGQAKGLGAFKQALTLNGIDLPAAYREFAIAAKFSKTCDAVYVAPYCFEEGAGYVTNAGTPKAQEHIDSGPERVTGAVPDNYALEWIRLPLAAGTFSLTLRNTSGGGMLQGDVVCDLGPLSGLRVDPIGSDITGGGEATLAGIDPTGCSSLVAVVTNVRQSAADPSTSIERGYSLRTSP